MKRNCIFLLLTLVGVISACTEKSANSFGIYLSGGTIDPENSFYGTSDWSHVEIPKKPVISDADILSYDFVKHEMTLKPGVSEQIRGSTGEGFVVEANHVPIYRGVIVSGIRQTTCLIPSIIVDERVMDTNLPPNVLRISRGYPEWVSPPGPDPRSDERIKNALAALRKLK